MARKLKIPNNQLERYTTKGHKRKKDIRHKRVYYLIVCEGEATEPNYFEGLKQDLPKGVLTPVQIAIEGTGRNTQSLVDEALRLKKKYEKERDLPIDKLWGVFDRDSFAPNDFNNTILRCQSVSPVIGCAWSNEAFELWYLLHFHFYQHQMSRGDYQKKIEENLICLSGGDYHYQKNSNEMYDLLKKHGNQNNAINNAKKLVKIFLGRRDFAHHNPCTMVWELVEELIKLNQN